MEQNFNAKATQVVKDDPEWRRLLEALSLRHIFNEDELSEMTQIEQQILHAYLRCGQLSEWYSSPELQQEEGIEAVNSERMIKWMRKIDQYLKICAYESLRKYYYALLVRIGREALTNPRALRRVDIEVLKLLHEIFSNYEAALDAWFEQFENTVWSSVTPEDGYYANQ